jgi:hypothetical protein
MSEVMTITITLIWSLDIVYIYENIPLMNYVNIVQLLCVSQNTNTKEILSGSNACALDTLMMKTVAKEK